MDLSCITPGDTVDLPFWPGRVVVEGFTYPDDYYRTSLVRLFWVATTVAAEGVTTLTENTDVHLASRFADYATRPAYEPWSRVWAVAGPGAGPDPDGDAPSLDDALAALRAKLEGAQ